MENSVLRNSFSYQSGVLLLHGKPYASQHTIPYNSGKKPFENLSDVRSEACAVDGFSYYLGYSLLGDDIAKNVRGRDREISSKFFQSASRL